MITTRKADLLLVCATLLAGMGWIFSKETVQEMPPFAFIGLRFTISALILSPFCFSAFKQVSTKQFGTSAAIGMLQGLALSLWIYSVSITDALGEGAFIMSLSMLFVPLCAWMIFRERPSGIFWVSLPVAGLGLYLLSLSGSWTLSGSQIFFLMAALTIAFQFICNSHFSKSIPTVFLTCIQFLFTGIFALVLSFIVEQWPSYISTETYYWLAASILPATCLRFLIQISGQKGTNAANAALIMILEPLWTVILSILWYGESFSFSKMAGCLLILLALFIYRFWHRMVLRRNRISKRESA
jgi:drug/metabolite transporter (DMT)-like permease